MKKKIISSLLAVTMIFAMVQPYTVFAEEVSASSEAETEDVVETEPVEENSDSEEDVTEEKTETEIIEEVEEEEQSVRDNTVEEQILDESEDTDPIQTYVDGKNEEAQSDFLYTVLDDGTAEITGYQGKTDGDLIIPSSIDGYTVTRIGNCVFSNCGFMGKLKIPEGIITIGAQAFSGSFDKIQFSGTLTLPKTLENIGYEAFSHCGFTGDLVLNDNIRNVEGSAFEYNKFDGKLVLSKSMKVVKATTFLMCQSFTGDLHIPGNIEKIEYGAFENAYNDEDDEERKLYLEEGVKEVESGAFGYCKFTGELVIPNSLEIIQEGGFRHAFTGKLVVNEIKEGFDEKAFFDYVGASSRGTMRIGEKYQATAYAGNSNLPENLIDSWEIGDPEIASISENGLVTAKSVGETTIIVEAYNGMKATIPLKVVESVTGVKRGNITWYIPERIKLGYEFRDMSSGNAQGGVSVAEVKNASSDVIGKQCWLPTRTARCFSRYFIDAGVPGSDITTNESFYPLFKGYTAVYPGTMNLQLYLYSDTDDNNGWKEEPYGEPYKVTVEEPLIWTNEPSEISVGETITLKSELQNIDLKNESVDYYKEILSKVNTQEFYWISEKLAYEPQYIVEQGKDLIECRDGDFSNTLKASEKIRFVKAGTVKIRVRYQSLKLCGILDDDITANYYSPEKEIVIQVNPQNVTATFNSAGGSNISSQTVAVGSRIVEPKDPVRSGYTFLGWYVDGQKYDFTKGVEKDITLVAKWKKQITNVTGISVDKNVLKMKQGQVEQLKVTVTPNNASNKAVKWETSNAKVATVKDGKVTAKNFGKAIVTATALDGSGKKISCNVTVGYAIDYKLNGGKNTKDNPAVYYNEVVKLKNPTRKGYNFVGWFADKKMKKQVKQITKKDKKDLNLYAKWEKIKVGSGKLTSATRKNASSMVIKYLFVPKAKGYEITYATDKKFKKNCKAVTTKAKSITLKKLQSKKTYYVKVRAYKLDSAGNKIYGKYSAVKTVKTAKSK